MPHSHPNFTFSHLPSSGFTVSRPMASHKWWITLRHKQKWLFIVFFLETDIEAPYMCLSKYVLVIFLNYRSIFIKLAASTDLSTDKTNHFDSFDRNFSIKCVRIKWKWAQTDLIEAGRSSASMLLLRLNYTPRYPSSRGFAKIMKVVKVTLPEPHHIPMTWAHGLIACQRCRTVCFFLCGFRLSVFCGRCVL